MVKSIGALASLVVVVAAGCSGAPARPTPGAAAVATANATAVALVTAASSSFAASTSAATATATAAASPTLGGPPPLRMGELPPGDYRTTAFDPQLVMTLPAGWSQFFPDEFDQIYMGSANAELAISRPEEVVDPLTKKGVPAPDDLMQWLADHPDLHVSARTPAEIDGKQVFYVEPATTREVPLLHFPGGDFKIVVGSKARIYVVPMEGRDLVITIAAALGGTLAAAVPDAEPIVESLVIAD